MSAVLSRDLLGRGWLNREPWTFVDRLQRDLERSFVREAASDEQAADWTPAVDVRETADAFVLTADLPGVNPSAIEVTTEKGLLTIRGARESEAANESNDYRRIERVAGTFQRRFRLPDTANIEGVTAKSNLGVLTLTIPKRAEVQPRKIEIQAN